MGLSGKQKKYLKKNYRKKSLEKIADNLGVSVKEIETCLQKRLGKDKYEKLVAKRQGANTQGLKEKAATFSFKNWLKKNWLILLGLSLLTILVYANGLNNGFVADDVYVFTKNPKLGEFGEVFTGLPILLRPFLYFIIKNLFGLNPLFYRLINLVFHLASVLTTYLLLFLLASTQVALFTATLLAIHPIQSEAVTWISGGPYSQYAFFLLLTLVTYILSAKNKKYYFLFIVSIILALTSSEKALVFPLILFVFILGFEKLTQQWKKLIFPSILGSGWVLFYLLKIPQRVVSLQKEYYQKPTILNPLTQIPVAISTYLQLIIWPKGLTLYHSEMSFSKIDYLFRGIVTLVFFGLTLYSYKKSRRVFFWLSLFIISLLPTLTPFGISSIVAERYVYLGAIGIYAVFALWLKKLSQVRSRRLPVYIFFLFLTLALLTRTIVRNADWKSEDTLWLAAARTSPSSAQNRNNLGDYYSRHNNLEKAAEEFEKAIQLNPNYGDAYHNLGNTYQRMGRIEEAIAAYQKAIEINPDIWQSHQNLGAIFYKQGNKKLAKEHLEKAVEINPENQKLKELLQIAGQ